MKNLLPKGCSVEKFMNHKPMNSESGARSTKACKIGDSANARTTPQ